MTTSRGAQYVRVGDGVWWCHQWLTVLKAERLLTSHRKIVVALTMGSADVAERVYYFADDEWLCTSRRRNRKRRLAKVATVKEAERAS